MTGLCKPWRRLSTHGKEVHTPRHKHDARGVEGRPELPHAHHPETPHAIHLTSGMSQPDSLSRLWVLCTLSKSHVKASHLCWIFTAVTRVQDYTNHPVWTGGKVVTADDGQIARFRRRMRMHLPDPQLEEDEKSPAARRDEAAAR